MDIEVIKNIYSKLGDDLSQKLFTNRLMHSITEDYKFIIDTVKTIPREKLLQLLMNCKTDFGWVIFGAGTYGKNLYLTTKDYPWKYFVDNKPKIKEFENLPVIQSENFYEDYAGEYVFISSFVYYREIYNQLIAKGIPRDKIIGMDGVFDDLLARQYFDLEYLNQEQEEEIFLDIGAFDGMNSVCFNKWCRIKNKVYMFEPDVSNQRKCRENCEKNNINYELIPKGAWSEEAILSFEDAGSMESKIDEKGTELIEVTSIDKAMGGEKVTFIKMDIEGAELQALIGAEKTIRNYKPKLAISVYHKPEDIWEIPELILRYNPDYKLYLRHYTLGKADTVLYAV